MEKYEEGYEKLLTYKQGMEIYRKTKQFTASFLHRIADSRLTGHMNDSARSVPSNIREGYKRNNTKAYLEFLGFARGSLEELKGDYEELKRELLCGERWKEKDMQGKKRIEKDIQGLLKLVYGEACMLGRQVKGLERKGIQNKSVPRSYMIQKGFGRAKADYDRFLRKAKDRFGIEKDEKGIIRKKKDPDKDGPDKKAPDKDGPDKG